MSDGYEILSLDDLDAYPHLGGNGAQMLPVRMRLGLRAFGASGWKAEAGKEIVPRHDEDSGDEELYAVVRGRATFTVGAETFDAPAGTLVHALAGTERVAIAAEPDTLVLAVGAPIGEAFEPRGWDAVTIAFGMAHAGDVEGGRRIMQEASGSSAAVAYNLACYESLFGDREEAFAQLKKAFELAPDEIRGYAEDDSDLDPLRDDPRFQELAG